MFYKFVFNSNVKLDQIFARIPFNDYIIGTFESNYLQCFEKDKSDIVRHLLDTENIALEDFTIE